MTALDSVAVRPIPRKYLRLWRFATELKAALWTPIRVFAGHWPVLFVLATAGVVGREGFIRAAVWLAGFNAFVGFLVFLLSPLTVIVALVAMLLVARSSLPSLKDKVRSGSLLRGLGNVLIPFVAFYMAFGLVEEDFRRYNDGLWFAYEYLGAQLAGLDQDDVRVSALDEKGANILVLVGIVLVAFLSRWALDRWELTRRSPVLGLPGAFLEVIWVVLGLLFVVKPVYQSVSGWAGERVAWHAVLDWWHRTVGMSGPLGQFFTTVDNWVVSAFPSGDFTRIFLVPITGLVSAAVVYNITVSDTLRPPVMSGRRRWLRYAVGAVVFAISRRFGPLIQGARAMGRSGVVPVMFFCLCVVALQTATQWLSRLEWTLVGPRDSDSIATGLSEAIDGLNDVILFVGLVCVLAAAVDGVARRNLRRSQLAGAVQSGGPAGSEPDVVR